MPGWGKAQVLAGGHAADYGLTPPAVPAMQGASRPMTKLKDLLDRLGLTGTPDMSCAST
jgi:hypothetical protein